MEDERLEREREEAEASTTAHGEPLTGWSSRLSTVFRTPTRASATQNGGTNPSSPVTPAASIKNRSRRSSLIQRLRPEMIRRMDDTPRLINPSGHYMENLRPTSPASPEPTASIRENVGSPGVTFVGKDVVSSPTAAQFPTLESVPEARPAPTPLPAISLAELESRLVYLVIVRICSLIVFAGEAVGIEITQILGASPRFHFPNVCSCNPDCCADILTIPQHKAKPPWAAFALPTSVIKARAYQLLRHSLEHRQSSLLC
jgi:hypothetical protein